MRFFCIDCHLPAASILTRAASAQKKRLAVEINQPVEVRVVFKLKALVFALTLILAAFLSAHIGAAQTSGHDIESSSGSLVADRRYQVLPGDTLSQVAGAVRADPSIPLPYAIAEIFRENPHAFRGGSSNQMRVGSWLTIPTQVASSTEGRMSSGDSGMSSSGPSLLRENNQRMATTTRVKIHSSTASSVQRSAQSNRITLSIRDTEIAEVMEMLAKQGRASILLSSGVSGKVSVNIYGQTLENAIHSIAVAAGYAVERFRGSYFVVERTEVGKYTEGDLTRVRTFAIEYSDAEKIQEIVESHLSSYGKAKALKEGNMIVVEDTPEFLRRVDKLIASLDHQPQQIMIEARILEITLDDSEAYGVDWVSLFDYKDGTGVVGTRGFSPRPASGFLVELLDDDLQIFLDALEEEGRTRTLSTPKLLALENEEASVIVGDRLGYVNTVTINQVTTESTEFLESGVILRVTPSIDSDDNIMLDIHPEVSTGTVSNGIPSQTTTSVSTKLLMPSGSTSFIGGLIKSRQTTSRSGVPLLGKLPLVGRLFSRQESSNINTETIVLITPTIVVRGQGINVEAVEKVRKLEQKMDADVKRANSAMDEFHRVEGIQ